MTNPAKTPAALQNFTPLVGDWQMEARVGSVVAATLSCQFSWLEGGAYLAMRTKAEIAPDDPLSWRGRAPEVTTAIIGYDDATDEFTYLYTDSRGVARAQHTDLTAGVWRIWGAAPGFSQRFEGMFSSDGNTITGSWSMFTDGTNWTKDFDVTYTRQSGR